MTETAWLIEQDSPARGPVWFSAIGPEWRFVSDANEALRFARKKDAETFIKWLGGNPLLSNPRATEHAWMAADGALGRQDEVVQPIRDEPISSSKGEALPVAWWAETGTAGAGEGCNKPFWLRSDAIDYVRKHGGYIAPLTRARPSPGVSREEVAP